MLNLKSFLIVLILFVGINIGKSTAQNNILRHYAPIDINQWTLWFSQWGTGCDDPYSKWFSGYFPIEKGGVIYDDEVLWGGVVHDGRTPALRVGGMLFRSGVVPGWIIKEGSPDKWPETVDPNSPRVRIYRIRRDIFHIDPDSLKQDAAITFHVPLNQVTEQLTDSLRARYMKDWNEWPADLGAPYYDRNRNGKYDPDYDEPGILGADQVIWYVVNDANDSRSMNLLGSPPIGIELQITVWAYRLGYCQTVFRRYRLINKSGAVIDSMFFSQFAEPDLGDFRDNLGGCDSARSFAFVYNGQANDDLFNRLGMAPPAVGYILLQGPAVPAWDSTGIVNFKRTNHIRNLPMTSFWLHQTGGGVPPPTLGDYENGTLDAYAILNGYAYGNAQGLWPQHKVSLPYSVITKFPANGNPLTGQGDIDGKGNSVGPGVRYFFMNTGPFTMQPGDVQDIIVATVGAIPDALGDNYSSLKNLFRLMDAVRQFYDYFPDFQEPLGPRNPKPTPTDTTKFYYFHLENSSPNPFTQNTLIRFQLHAPLHVQLTVYNTLGQKIRTLFNGTLNKGQFGFRWDGRNSAGILVPSGVYFVRLKSQRLVQWQKILFLK